MIDKVITSYVLLVFVISYFGLYFMFRTRPNRLFLMVSFEGVDLYQLDDDIILK